MRLPKEIRIGWYYKRKRTGEWTWHAGPRWEAHPEVICIKKIDYRLRATVIGNEEVKGTLSIWTIKKEYEHITKLEAVLEGCVE